MFNLASRISYTPRTSFICIETLGQTQRRMFVATLALVALLFVILSAGVSESKAAPSVCSKVASSSGSDAGSGSVSSPVRTAQELINALSAGQTGCLRAGTYSGGMRFNHGGSSGAPIVVRSYPGEQALVTGHVYVPHGSNYVTVADLNLDGNYQGGGARLPSPTIDASNVTFESDDVTDDHTGICFDVGSVVYGAASAIVLSGNRIHDCGQLPATNHNHGIYAEDVTGMRVVGNLIDHNADRGIQLYPYSSGAVISGNVIAYNGEGIIFSGDEGVASNNNVVEHNLIVGSLIRSDVESWYPEGNPIGSGNVVRGNCVSSKGIDLEEGGFSAVGNVTASASEIIAAGVGYHVAAGSACAAVIPNLVNPQQAGA